MITLFYGGASSGKSQLAEDCAVAKKNASACELFYLATMLPFGSEGVRRIENHKKKRAGKGFFAVEQYRDIQNAKVSGTVLLECVSNLLANEMFRENPKPDVCEYILDGIKKLSETCENLIIVSSDLSHGCENASEETLLYIENIKKINTAISEFADEVYNVRVGIAIKNK